MSLLLIYFCVPNIQASYFTERGSRDAVLEMFVNADGDPTQFSVMFFVSFL
jgi:hypothetical protein